MRTLGKTTWDKIKVGEVFAEHGCWLIGYKLNTREYLCIAETWNIDFFIPAVEEIFKPRYDLYKLPKAVQNLWRCV